MFKYSFLSILVFNLMLGTTVLKAQQPGPEDKKHMAAPESESGDFTLIGFGIDSDDSDEATTSNLSSWKPLFVLYQLHELIAGYGGTDISPLKKQQMSLLGLGPDSQRYFYFHHTSNDVFENVNVNNVNVNKGEKELGAEAMSSLAYLIDPYGL